MAAGGGQASRIDQKINDLSSSLARTALLARERAKHQDMDSDVSLQGIYKSPSLYSRKDSAAADATDKLLIDEGTESGFSGDTDSADVPASDEEGASEPSFNISVRNGGEEKDDDEDSGMGVREFLAMQR